MSFIKNIKTAQMAIMTAMVCFVFMLTGCGGGGGGGGDGIPGLGGVDTNYPHLKSAPQVSFIQNVNDLTKYDITVTVEADGPNGVFSAGLWLHSKDDSSVFTHLDLQHVGGTTWTATTYSFVPMPAGNYYLDSIIIEDGDAFAGGLVKSSWYESGFFSSTSYDVDQRETDWTTVDILQFNIGVSNIPIVNFAIP